MVTQTNGNRTPDMTPRTETNGAFVVALFTRVNHLCFDVSEAQAALGVLKAALLPTLASQLEGVAPVSEPAWAADWAQAAKDAYLASGRCTQTDPKKIELSMGSAVSAQKIAVIGLTNGIAPVADESLKTYVDRARRVLKDRKIIEGVNKPSDNAPAPRTPTVKAPVLAPANLALQFAKGDENMADALMWAAGAGKRAFLAFYAMQMALAAS